MTCPCCGLRVWPMNLCFPTCEMELVCEACMRMVIAAEALAASRTRATRASDSGLPVDTVNPRY